MDIQRLGLIDTLVKITNYENESSPAFVIAKYILENYYKIADMNIYDVAAQCYVSRSSIRRFCMQIGYDNFYELKKAFKNFDYQYSYFLPPHKKDNYREWYANEVISTIKEIEEIVSESMLEDIARNIHDSERVIFLSSYSTVQCVAEFQRPLVLLNKIIKVMTEKNFSQEMLLSLNEKDAVFVASSMGNFARATLDELTGCLAYKALITASLDPIFNDRFDDIYHLTKHDYSTVKSAHGKYGMFYLFDILYDIYLKKYG